MAYHSQKRSSIATLNIATLPVDTRALRVAILILKAQTGADLLTRAWADLLDQANSLDAHRK